MSRNIYIAGASSRARTTREYLEFLEPDTRVAAYLVSPDMTDNPETVDGLPVLKIRQDSSIDTSARVYLGMRGVNHPKVTKELLTVGFYDKNIIPVTVDVDTALRNEYVAKRFNEAGKSFVKFDDFSSEEIGRRGASACIYEAGSAFDGILSDEYTPLKEERMIQVGAALTDKRLSENIITDDSGENISTRNRQFCELTGLYWIWKNAPEDIVGLVHYRRHFLLPEDWVEIFEANDVDVILPVPLYVAPSVELNYRQRHVSDDWDHMMERLETLHPDDHDKALKFFSDGLYSPCNMLIAKKSVLDELCEWMFPILLAVADTVGEHEDRYQNRYPGFMSERLISYFFESRRDRFKVVYSDKNFLN